jgi:hypothetical protein
MAKKNIQPNLIITELFLVKADWQRTFIGSIKRTIDLNGIPVVFGEAIIQDGKIWSKAINQEVLMKSMDDICIMKLDMGLHSTSEAKLKLNDIDISLN